MSKLHPTQVLLTAFLLLAACSGSVPQDGSPAGEATATQAEVNAAEEDVAEEEEGAEPAARLFSFYGEDPAQPIIANGAADHWTGKYLNPGGVVYHEGMFHMFLNAFHSWPGTIRIGHFTSPDGLNWTMASEEPIFESTDIPFVRSGQGADVSSALVLEDGSWVLYFHVEGSNAAGIGRATAPSAEGPWSFDEEPVLTPGSDGEWDARKLSWPNVVATDTGFVMFYTGEDNAGNKAIGRATSKDGIRWIKHNHLDTAEAPYVESDPMIVGSGGGWDLSRADRPRAQLTPEGWVMLYTGSQLNNRGLVFSPDGHHWSEHPDNPVIAREDFPIEGGSTWDTNLLYVDGVYYYFMELGALNTTAIYLALHEGALGD